MIDFETLPIDTVFYTVKRVNNSLKRKRFEFTDNDGHVWHRYDLPIWDVEVRQHKLVARMRKHVEGIWCVNPEDAETEYLVEYSNGTTDYFYPDSPSQYFLNKDDAEHTAAKLRNTLETKSNEK